MAYDQYAAEAMAPFVPAVPKPNDQTGQQRRSAYYENPKRLYWGQLTGSDVVLYSVPTAPTLGPAPKVKITEIVVCNTDSSACTLTLQIRTVAGGSAAATHLFSATSFAANTTTRYEMDTMMETLDVISALAGTASKLNVRISGIEYLALPTG